jgi:hypothetical protein
VTAALAGDRDAWTRSELELSGFEGWITFAGLAGPLGQLTSAGGVYLVFRSGGEPRFLLANPGGRFKGRDPSISDDALRANWVTGAEILYIGKADNLRRRLREYARFGEGAPIGHWGGRLIWQLEDSAELLVAWRETPGLVPRDVEAEMIAAFRAEFGKPPFANDPHRLGLRTQWSICPGRRPRRFQHCFQDVEYRQLRGAVRKQRSSRRSLSAGVRDRRQPSDHRWCDRDDAWALG